MMRRRRRKRKRRKRRRRRSVGESPQIEEKIKSLEYWATK